VNQCQPTSSEEGYKYSATIPILHDGEVIASFNLFSMLKETISEQALISLDFLAGQLGNIIVRIEVQQKLEQEIKTRTEAEKALYTERQGLEEANIALKVLLRQREKDKEELEQRFVSNVNELVLPYVEKLKKNRLDGLQRTTLGLIETNLREILSPFRYNVRNFNLTPRQLEIVSLIKQGRATKEIAELLSATKDAIDKQRFIIRKKLGVNNDKTNLRSLLLSL
jgi:DNA-binding CsgD family transcriptional regulator